MRLGSRRQLVSRTDHLSLYFGLSVFCHYGNMFCVWRKKSAKERTGKMKPGNRDRGFMCALTSSAVLAVAVSVTRLGWGQILNGPSPPKLSSQVGRTSDYVSPTNYILRSGQQPDARRRIGVAAVIKAIISGSPGVRSRPTGLGPISTPRLTWAHLIHPLVAHARGGLPLSREDGKLDLDL